MMRWVLSAEMGEGGGEARLVPFGGGGASGGQEAGEMEKGCGRVVQPWGCGSAMRVQSTGTCLLARLWHGGQSG